MKNPDKLNQKKNAKSALVDTSRFVIWANWAFKTDHNLWGRKETEQLLLKTFIWSNSLECNSQWSESETTETDESGCWPESQSTNNTCSHLRPHCFSIINFFFFFTSLFPLSFFLSFWIRDSKNYRSSIENKTSSLVIQRKKPNKKTKQWHEHQWQETQGDIIPSK